MLPPDRSRVVPSSLQGHQLASERQRQPFALDESDDDFLAHDDDEDFALPSGAALKRNKEKAEQGASKKQKASAEAAEKKGAARPSAAAPSFLTSAAASSSQKENVSNMTAPALPTSIEEAVLQYIVDLNQPVSAQMVADHFRGSVSKAQAEKHLADLLEATKLRMTEFGKIKAYYPEMKHVAAPTSAEMAELEAQLTAAKAEQQRCSKLLSDAQSEIKARKTRLSLPEARKEADTLKAELEREQQALAILQQAAGGLTLTPAQADSVKLNYKRLLKIYKSRRSKCLEIIDKICEFSNKPLKKMLDEWGLERDEEYGVLHTNFPSLA